jgi:hypothetical protein
VRSFFSRLFVLSTTFLSTTLFFKPSFHAAAVSLSQRASDRIPCTESAMFSSTWPISFGMFFNFEQHFLASRCNSHIQKYLTRVYLLVFIDLPTAQAHLRSHVRNRVGAGMVAAIRRGGGVRVQVGRAYVGENRHWQEIPSLAVAVGREDLRRGDSWNVRHTFGWATPGILAGSRHRILNIEY